MSTATKCAILLEISSGAATRLPFSLESLKDGNVVAIMDEIHEVIWLWMGKNTGLVMRRGSMRAARSLKAYGHEIGKSIVGRKLKDVVPVDGLKIESDDLEKAKFEKVMSLFTREHVIKAEVLAEYTVQAVIEQRKYYGLSKDQRDNLVTAAISAPSAGDDVRKIEEIVGEFRPRVPDDSSTSAAPPTVPQQPNPPPAPTISPPPAPSPSPPPTPAASTAQPPQISTPQVAATPSSPPVTSTIEVQKPTPAPVDENALGDVKAALVLSSVLSEYTDIFVGVKPQGNIKIYSVESQAGLICKFSLDKAKIKFLPGSWDRIGVDQKRKIQRLFVDRMKKIIGT